MRPSMSSKQLAGLADSLVRLVGSEPQVVADLRALAKEVAYLEKMPRIVCLVGSTGFYEMFRRENLRRTLAGAIVLSIGCDTKSADDLNLSEQDKVDLDHLHLWKVRLADEVRCINVNGYVGESTLRAIQYATSIGTPVSFLEPPSAQFLQAFLAPSTPLPCPSQWARSVHDVEPDVQESYTGRPAPAGAPGDRFSTRVPVQSHTHGMDGPVQVRQGARAVGAGVHAPEPAVPTPGPRDPDPAAISLEVDICLGLAAHFDAAPE